MIFLLETLDIFPACLRQTSAPRILELVCYQGRSELSKKRKRGRRSATKLRMRPTKSMNGHDTKGPAGMPNTQSFKQLWAEKEYAGGTQYMDELGFRSHGLDDMMDSDSESDTEDLNETSDNPRDDISIKGFEPSKHVGSVWREGDNMY